MSPTIFKKLNYEFDTPEKRLDTDTIIKYINDNFKELSDVVFSVGGDGTMLHTMRETRDATLKIVGINTGNVGFLTPYGKEDMLKLKHDLENKTYRVEKRSKLYSMSGYTAVNEFSITGETPNSVIDFSLIVEHEDVISRAGRYSANSVIISGPCGSTAYNMNTGGAIVDPVMKCMQMTMVAPMTLGARPLIFSKDSKIIINVHGNFRGYVDGREIPDNNPVIAVRLHEDESQIIVPKDWNFYSNLATKLHWNNGAAV